MTPIGALIAKRPISPHPNLTAIERAGTTKSDSAVWQVACTCGATFRAVAYGFRIGETKCQRCQPSRSDAQAIEILMLLPATLPELVNRLGICLSTIKSRVRAMRKHGFCHIGKWRRAGNGFHSVIVPGPGDDVPCKLVPRTGAEYLRKYRKRVRNAIEKAAAGGKEDPRYIRHVALHKVMETVKRTRAEPQNPFSALFTRSQA